MRVRTVPLEQRFTIGRSLALAARAAIAGRWQALLILAPIAALDIWVRWFLLASVIDPLSGAWQAMINTWVSSIVQTTPFAIMIVSGTRYAQGRSAGLRSVREFPWRRLPIVTGAGLIVATLTYWPASLLDWNATPGWRALVNYPINIVNVLTVETLTFTVLPVLLMERQSLVGAFRRSVHLIRGHPWRVLTLDVVVWIVYWVLTEIVWTIQRTTQSTEVASAAAWTVWIVIMDSIAAFVTASTYHLLRTEREGPPAETLAKVFD